MCSIEGTTNPDFDISLFSDLNKCRGPDGTDFYKDENVNFAHNLLEISPNPKRKTQPFVTEKGNVLVYNGEIYGLGDDVWDVEWLANYIESNGVEGLKEDVNGMWAFAWYEPSKSRVTLCRDHFGIKPLYYSFIKDYLYFSSTFAPIATTKYSERGQLNLLEFDNVFVNQVYKFCDGFNPGRRTPIADIYKLYPGEYIEVDVKNNKITSHNSFWRKSNYKLKPNFLWNKWELDEIVKECISEVCNAPGIKKTISLSGGLDSSLIASIARNKDNISASSVHWENVNIQPKDPSRHMMDEITLSKETCKWLGMDHYVTEIPHDNEEYHDEVYMSMFGIPTWDIQRLLPRFFNITQASNNNNKVYISGDCADEILTGYNGDFKIHSHDVLDINALYNLLGYNPDHKPKERDVGYREVGRLLKEDMFGSDSINNRQLASLLYHSDGFCTVLDHMCGYYGMESRVPFLHQKLVKYLMTIPGAMKMYVPFNDVPGDSLNEKKDYIFFMMGHYKGILREHLGHHYVPNVRNRMRKTGFSNPWNARDSKKNENLRMEQYNIQKSKVRQETVDFKDNLVYNAKHDIKSENVNE